MRIKTDVLGNRYGRLIVESGAGMRHRRAVWNCICDCGGKIVVSGTSLRDGTTQSCGCLHKERHRAACTTHGLSKHPINSVWRGMMRRCYSSKCKEYANYGARGIVVCARWHDLTNFYADMGARPAGRSIDRINNDGNYEPSNCRWATAQEQGLNTRFNVFVEHDGRRQTVAEWAREVGMRYGKLLRRLNNGWPPARALS